MKISGNTFDFEIKRKKTKRVKRMEIVMRLPIRITFQSISKIRLIEKPKSIKKKVLTIKAVSAVIILNSFVID